MVKISCVKTLLLKQIKDLEAKVSEKQTALNTLQSQLSSLIAQATADAEATQTLAEQGLTPEAVQEIADAEAEAIVKNAEEEAQSKKSKRWIVIAIAGVVIVLGAIYLYRRIKRK
jgi:cobalamin biosynthesis Mg chelatase CobN